MDGSRDFGMGTGAGAHWHGAMSMEYEPFHGLSPNLGAVTDSVG